MLSWWGGDFYMFHMSFSILGYQNYYFKFYSQFIFWRYHVIILQCIICFLWYSLVMALTPAYGSLLASKVFFIWFVTIEVLQEVKKKIFYQLFIIQGFITLLASIYHLSRHNFLSWLAFTIPGWTSVFYITCTCKWTNTRKKLLCAFVEERFRHSILSSPVLCSISYVNFPPRYCKRFLHPPTGWKHATRSICSVHGAVSYLLCMLCSLQTIKAKVLQKTSPLSDPWTPLFLQCPKKIIFVSIVLNYIQPNIKIKDYLLLYGNRNIKTCFARTQEV